MRKTPNMQWRAGSGTHFYHPMGHYFVRLADGTLIEVRPDIYDQRFTAYLEQIGVKRTSWYEIMQRAEQEWQHYCGLMERFAEDYQQWLDQPGNGVFVTPGNRETTPDTKTNEETPG